MSNERPILNCEDHLEFSKAYKWIMRRTELNDSDKLIYIRLRNCTYKMGEYWVSLDYLAHECGTSKATVKRSINRLIKFGLLSKTQHGKKMFNSYCCHIHEWMTDDDKFKKSDSSNCTFTTGDSSNCTPVTAQIEPSIYKEQNKKQNNICDFSKKTSQTKINQQLKEQIKEVYKHWQKEIKKPAWTLTDQRMKKIKSALVTGIKQVDPETLEKFELPLSVDQVKELISLHMKQKWWVENNRIDLTSILTQQRMTDYVEGKLNKDVTNKSTNKLDNQFNGAYL